MGRIRKACITSLLCISLLCGCDRAGEINPELTKVSVDAAGTVTYTDEDGNVHYGQDAWGDTAPATSYTYDPAIVEGNPFVDWDAYFSVSAYNSSVEEAMTAPIITTTLEEVIVDLPTITTSTNTTVPPVINIDEDGNIVRPTPDTYKSYSPNELLSFYGYSDFYGYYKYDYTEHCSYDGFIGQAYEGSYDEACVAFIEQLGAATFEYTAGNFTHSYWLTSGKVYSVSEYKDGNVSIGQGYYSSSYESYENYNTPISDLKHYTENGHETLTILYKEFGSPTHYDSFVAVWKTATKMYVVDRRTTLTLILEV